MEEPTVTCAAIVSLAEKIEDDSSQFYEKLADKFVENKEEFHSFSKENRKNKILITRTYRETISDALEACFVGGLDLSDDLITIAFEEDTSFVGALKIAIELEDKVAKFYTDIAEKTRSLLATIPMAFRKVAKNRENRKQKLNLLLGSAE